MNNSLLNTAVRTLMVAKVDLPPFLAEEEVNLGLYSNWYDCFLLNGLSTKKLETRFKLSSTAFAKKLDRIAEEDREPTEEELNPIVNIEPTEGDKFIGMNRDKGSITAVMREYTPRCKWTFNNNDERDNFINFQGEIDNPVIEIGDCYAVINIDMIANPSTDRDNVGALVLNSMLELDCVLENKEIELTIEEAQSIDILELSRKRKWHHEVYLVDGEGNNVHSFGEVPVLAEDFFWQPQHGNRFAIKEKDISLNYHQALDALNVLTPTLYETVIRTVNHNSIKEDMMSLGLEIGSKNDYIINEKFNNVEIEEDEDIF